MDIFKTFIERHTPLPAKDWETIQRAFTKKEVLKNELILSEGEICRNFYFLERGLLRYFYNIDGKEVVKTFTIPPFCFTSKISFRNQRPAQESIQALEDSVVWQTNYVQYRELEKMETWNNFINSLLNEIDEFSDMMMIQSKTLTPDQRYQWLTRNFPASVLQRIPQKDIASFLGIAPQSLSRIKHNMLKKR
ncbi:Crp/Fnr family transcriptional regulator [Saccharicrinis sp. FJH54]|uniref:Crp/Fnr family transcriptional regulator n=1 Tax=Saccharicrinis sp. FJH54 TaxID=3344665 RepID=UPI0035D4785D